MRRLNSKFKFTIILLVFCGAYWLMDSAWSFLSFEKNLSQLVFQEPMSYADTLLLKVSPYQVVSRIMVVGIFTISGIVIFIFMGKRKRAQEEKVRLERQLIQAQKMESLGTLAGGIAHDFNNILYGALGFIELCLDDTEPDSLIHTNLREIRSGLQRAKSLVSQILAFSRQTHSKIEPTQVAPVADEILKLLRSTIPTTIDIQADTVVANDTIIGDSTQIHQVLMNLCTNAAHAMEDNGGTLNIALDNVDIGSDQKEVYGTDVSPGPYIRISVSDTGKGIPPEDLNRVFDPFFTSKEQGKGTGMGLAVVHGIVHDYKGFIQLKSIENQGTTFELYFPLLNGRADPKEKTHAHGPPKGRAHPLPLADRQDARCQQ